MDSQLKLKLSENENLRPHPIVFIGLIFLRIMFTHVDMLGQKFPSGKADRSGKYFILWIIYFNHIDKH